MRSADHACPGQRLEAAHPAQATLQVLVVPLDPLLDRLPGLVEDAREDATSAGVYAAAQSVATSLGATPVASIARQTDIQSKQEYNTRSPDRSRRALATQRSVP
jgi:hypothetical protein